MFLYDVFGVSIIIDPNILKYANLFVGLAFYSNIKLSTQFFYFCMSIGTPLGAARDWGITEERGESVVRANEDEDDKS